MLPTQWKFAQGKTSEFPANFRRRALSFSFAQHTFCERIYRSEITFALHKLLGRTVLRGLLCIAVPALPCLATHTMCYNSYRTRALPNLTQDTITHLHGEIPTRKGEVCAVARSSHGSRKVSHTRGEVCGWNESQLASIPPTRNRRENRYV